MKKIIEENEKIAVNTKEIEILKKHFPNCFNKDGEFQMDKFEKRISQEVDVTKEGYELRWLGKNYARLLANVETETMIVDDKEHNDKVENKNSENIYIEGDNIDVLKHLKNAYSEKIKMIYIDPPYNTGSDGFVYKDDRKYTKEDLAELTNITEEEAQRILSFNTKGSNSHSAWLTFMYPRLLTARELLSDDGVIFISIDDNEVSQLKLLCDEVFGEENFAGQITIVNNPRGRDYGGIAKMHEYIIVYFKTENSNINLLSDKGKKFQYSDLISGFDLRELRNRNIAFNKENRPNLYYPFYINKNNILDNELYEISIEKKEGYIELYPKESQGIRTVWRWGKDKAFKNININIAAKKMQDGGFQIVEKYRKEEKMARSVGWDKEDNSEKGTLLLKNIFEGRKIFNFPKSKEVIEKLVEMGSDPNSLILDFFSGSATTAHAVMQLNAEDGGNRKFIMVQIQEEIDPKKSKAAYDFCVDELKQEPVITTIGKERIKRAANKIKKENESKLEEKPLDLGFKLFKTKSIPEKYIERMKDENNELLVTKMLSKEELQALLITWKTYDGYPLTKELKTVQFGKYNSYVVDRILYLVNTDFNLENLLEFIKKLDSDGNFVINKIVIFGYHFNSDILLTIKDMVTTYRNKKSIELDVEVRY